MRLLIATRNRHKLDEIRAILNLPALRLLDLTAFPGAPEVEEDGATFEANACKKAATLARFAGLWTLADDSGLEVESLDNAPGVWSARYAGEPCDHAANNAKLLRELSETTDRRARFRCVLALASPTGKTRTVSGRCEGRIALVPHGTQGFGYDPLFIPLGHERTFAELPPEMKNCISHRARALAAAAESWRTIFESNPAASHWMQTEGC